MTQHMKSWSKYVTFSESVTDCRLLLRCKGLASLTWLHLLQVVPKPNTLTTFVAKLDLDYHYIAKKIPNPDVVQTISFGHRPNH